MRSVVFIPSALTKHVTYKRTAEFCPVRRKAKDQLGIIGLSLMLLRIGYGRRYRRKCRTARLIDFRKINDQAYDGAEYNYACPGRRILWLL